MSPDQPGDSKIRHLQNERETKGLKWKFATYAFRQTTSCSVCFGLKRERETDRDRQIGVDREQEREVYRGT